MEEEEERQILTVLGPLSPSALSGVTVCSEHLFSDFGKAAELSVQSASSSHRLEPVSLPIRGSLVEDPYSNLDNLILNNEAAAELELRAYKASGGAFLVDSTPSGVGRNPKALRRLSEKTGVQIVMASGYPGEWMLSEHLVNESEEALSLSVQREFLGGVVESDAEARIYPGVISASISTHLNEQDKKLLRACAKAHTVTAAPLLLSATATSSATHSALDIFGQAGCNMKKVVVLGAWKWCEESLEIQTSILQKGCSLAFDCVGAGPLLFPESRVEGHVELPADDRLARAIAMLVERGFASQVLLSHGYHLKMQWTSWGGMGFCHLLQRFVPRLKRLGVKDKDIETMLISNMRELLTFYRPPKVEKEPEIGWLCDFCGKGQDKEKEAFTKFRFQYCSMKCLSGHGKKTNYWTDI